MRKITLIFAMLFCFASYGQVETNITQNLVTYLNGISNWNNKIYGCCAGDSTNAEEQDEALCVEQIYVVDLSLIGVDELFINKRVEMRNGTLKVINGTVVFDDTNGGEFVTYEFGDCASRFVFNENNDNGRVYFSMADYLEAQEALSIKDIKTSIENIGKLPRDMQMEIYDIMGRVRLKGNTSDYTLKGLKNDFNGIYILKITDGNTVATIKQVF